MEWSLFWTLSFQLLIACFIGGIAATIIRLFHSLLSPVPRERSEGQIIFNGSTKNDD